MMTRMKRMPVAGYVVLAVSAAPVVGATESSGYAEALADPARVAEAATVRCPVVVGLAALALIEAQPPDSLDAAVRESLHNGDFIAAGAADAGDPRDGLVDTGWVSASWASPAGVLWGRDYAPNDVFEGITRLLDNRQTRRNAYALSFAALTPRLAWSLVCHQDARDCWLILSVNGLKVGVPAGLSDSRLGWPLCAQGLFFLDDAFDARGYIPARYW